MIIKLMSVQAFYIEKEHEYNKDVDEEKANKNENKYVNT